MRVLSTADDVLFVLALGILVLAAVSWFVGGRRNPLFSIPERPNSVRENVLALAAAVYLVAALIISGVVQSLTGGTESLLGGLAVGNGAQLAGIGACLFLGATRFDGGLGAFLRGITPKKNRAAFALNAAGLSVVAIVICPEIQVATASIILRLVPDYQFKAHPTVLALHDGSLGFGFKVAFWMGAAIVAPVAEELFFRGLLQTFLVNVVRSRWIAILVASTAFGLVHHQQPSAIPALFVLAVIMGYAYERSGSLVWPIAIHSAFNFKTLVWDALGGGGT